MNSYVLGSALVAALGGLLFGFDTAAGQTAAKPIDAKTVFADAVAAWHFGDLQSADGKSPLVLRGDAKVGVELRGEDRAASLARGGDGRVADFGGGWLDAGQGADGRLNLRGEAMTLLVRLRNPSGKWTPGEIFAKHGGHDRLVYNLFNHADRIGFEYGAQGQPGLAGQITLPLVSLQPGRWHDVIVRYDGKYLEMFLDGLRVGRAAASGALRGENREPVLIGRRGFQGQMDHAALWSRALADDEITALSGGPALLAKNREAFAREIEARIGREGLTLADQLRGARELRERLWNDPHRPRYHLLPPDGFWNDINGTIFWKGRYHVFFLGRLAPDRDTILAGRDTLHPRETWLHSSSRDLVHWIHHPPALVPVFDGSMPRGFYSGDMINDAPVPTIIVHVPGQGTCIYRAEDDELLRWKPLTANPVIPIPKGPAEYGVFDPCAWKEGDFYYALVGNKNRRPGFEGDSTSLFRSRDLAHWEYRGPFYKSERRWTDEIEDCACPDFFPLGNKHMLLMHTHRPYGQCQYYLGRYENERFYPEIHGRMNWPNGQICAPETLRDDRGRRIFWGWIHEARSTAETGWASVASLPRVLSLAPEETLRIEPAPELEVLRCNPRRRTDLTVSGELKLPDIRGQCLELSLEIDPGDARELGLAVRCSPDGAEQTAVACVPAEKSLAIELGKSTLDPLVSYAKARPAGAAAPRQVAPFELRPGEPLRLRVFLDRSVLEVFANERQCVTQRIYPSRPDSLGVELFSRGGTMRVVRMDAWDMSPTNSW